MVECLQSDIDALSRGEAADAHESGPPDPRGYQQTMPGLLTLRNRPVPGVLKGPKLILSLTYHTDKIKA